jgi:hypothetical protein
MALVACAANMALESTIDEVAELLASSVRDVSYVLSSTYPAVSVTCNQRKPQSQIP